MNVFSSDCSDRSDLMETSLEMTSQSFKLIPREYSGSFNLSNVVTLFRSWIVTMTLQFRDKNENSPSYVHVLRVAVVHRTPKKCTKKYNGIHMVIHGRYMLHMPYRLIHVYACHRCNTFQHMMVHGYTWWSHMASMGIRVIYGSTWYTCYKLLHIYMAINGYTWWYMAIPGDVWLFTIHSISVC